MAREFGGVYFFPSEKIINKYQEINVVNLYKEISVVPTHTYKCGMTLLLK